MAPPTTTKPDSDNPDLQESGDQSGGSEAPETRAARAASDARSPSALSQETVEKATDWFLSEQEEQPTILYFDVNVAAAGMPARWVRWGVRALGRHTIKTIRENATDPETGVMDDMEVNLRVLIAASVEPDFTSEAVRGKHADPADLVNARFAHKPGVIESIARKANEMSGYGNAQNIRAVDAAGN